VVQRLGAAAAGTSGQDPGCQDVGFAVVFGWTAAAQLSPPVLVLIATEAAGGHDAVLSLQVLEREL
jgi:hypothetical protein